MKATVAFIFLAPEADSNIHRSVVDTPVITTVTVAVKDYEDAKAVAEKLVEEGAVAIELCAGFGHEGLAMICKAVGRKVAVGAVRFDYHPSLGFKSGDELFGGQ